MRNKYIIALLTLFLAFGAASFASADHSVDEEEEVSHAAHHDDGDEGHHDAAGNEISAEDAAALQALIDSIKDAVAALTKQAGGMSHDMHTDAAGAHHKDSHGDTHGDAAHSHADTIEVSEDAVPTIKVTVHEDPKSGWNVELDITNHAFAPERASTAHIEGEGHAHIYVDGKKINRLYSDWYHLGTLGGPGTHEVRVELSANSHNPLSHDGEIIDDTVMVTVN